MKGTPMSAFDKREQVFEGKFAHDEEIEFKVLARANKMLGLWAAQQLGKSGADADAYANALVNKDIVAHIQSGVLSQIHNDFVNAGVRQSEHQIARHLEEFHATAKKDVSKG
jgi:hypothetical protein